MHVDLGSFVAGDADAYAAGISTSLSYTVNHDDILLHKLLNHAMIGSR